MTLQTSCMSMKKLSLESVFLYDVINKQEIEIPAKGLMEACNKVGIDYTIISKLRQVFYYQCQHRYILSSHRHLTFTLADVDTLETFECITPTTLFLHLNIPHNTNDAKYIYELKSKRQQFATIGGRVMRLQGGKVSHRVISMKGKSEFIRSQIEGKRTSNDVKALMHGRICKAIFSGNDNKGIMPELTGCTASELREYIEGRFTKNMNWGNRSLWNIDHIIPCAAYDLRDPKQLSKCFHYTNLQPIWATSKIASEMGESKPYVGNLNKNDHGDTYDYFLNALIKKSVPELAVNSEGLCTILHKKKIRRLINP